MKGVEVGVVKGVEVGVEVGVGEGEISDGKNGFSFPKSSLSGGVAFSMRFNFFKTGCEKTFSKISFETSPRKAEAWGVGVENSPKDKGDSVGEEKEISLDDEENLNKFSLKIKKKRTIKITKTKIKINCLLLPPNSLFKEKSMVLFFR
ncbi:hypothetical protein H5T58_00340 [Candidatus Parcubacteria bacterium]|nr:hypothetical protein [Candidatus Parcubacteria bacterium]